MFGNNVNECGTLLCGLVIMRTWSAAQLALWSVFEKW